MDMFEAVEVALRKRYYGWEGTKQFDGTADRLKRLIDEMCWTQDKINKELEKCFEAMYVEPFDEMLVEGPIEVWTFCPHHLLPCLFEVHIGYVPNEQVLGLSKFSRIAITLGKRPVIQEMYSRELADILWEKLKPKGVGVHVVGSHGCMCARGIKQHASVTTSVLRGVMKDKPESRSEFYSIVRGGKKHEVV